MNFSRKTNWKETARENRPWKITLKWGPEDMNWPKTESSSRFLWTWQYTSTYWPAEWLYSFWKIILYDIGQQELLCSLAILKHHTKNMSKIYCNIILAFVIQLQNCFHMKPADASIRKYSHSLVIMWLCAVHTSKIQDVYQRWHIRANGNWVTRFMPALQMQNPSKRDIKPA
jgi:hypothetical protein